MEIDRTTVQGVIRRAGAPLGGVSICVTDPSGEFFAEQHTGDDGYFTFDLPAGFWTLEVAIDLKRTLILRLDVTGGRVLVDPMALPAAG